MQILWKFIETCLLQGLYFFPEMIAKEEIARVILEGQRNVKRPIAFYKSISSLHYFQYFQLRT